MEASTYKQLMKHHAGAPVIIASGRPGARTGLTATAFCSLSDSPPTVLVCVNKGASAHPVIADTRSFSVNVLRNDQAAVAACFAGQTGLKGEQRFREGDWAVQQTGAPVMRQALATLDCELLHAHDHGTHTVFVGLVHAVNSDETSDPLIYFRGGFNSLGARAESACTA
ncbi:MAG: flavin reductase family protein [Pseudomonadota bacterium]